MALVVGAIIVNSDGTTTVTTPGMAPNIFAARAAQITFPDPSTPPVGWPSTLSAWTAQSLPILISMKQDLVNEAVAIATGVVTSMTSDASVTVTITTSEGALQQASGVDTTPPTATRTLLGVIS